MTPVFFTDRDLGKSFPRALRDAGLQIEEHAAHFPHDAADDLWLAAVGAYGWFVISHNRRIRYTPNERDAVIAAGVGLFLVIGKGPLRGLAENFVRSIDRVHDFIAKTSRPFIAKVYSPSPSEVAVRPRAPGRVDLWYP